MSDRNDPIEKLAQKELSHPSFLNTYREKRLLEDGKFQEVAEQQLDKLYLYSWFGLALVLIFSAWAVYQLINFGETNNLISLLLGLAMWIAMIIFTYLFTREIVSKKRTLQIVLKLLDSTG